MNILAIESSAKSASCAVVADGKLTAQYFQNSGLTHSRTLLKMTDDMLKSVDMKIAEMDVIAVAAGPGSFTGVRIGVAAAKGLAWGAEKPVCGVSTLEAMAYQLSYAEGIICPVMDARRSQVYNARFSFSGGLIRRLSEDRAIAIDELISEAKKEERPYFLVGDGAEMCYNHMSEAGISVYLPPEPLLHQTAWGVAKAAESAPFTSPNDLVPNYLRLSQAERERLEREGSL